VQPSPRERLARRRSERSPRATTSVLREGGSRPAGCECRLSLGHLPFTRSSSGAARLNTPHRRSGRVQGH
jgi:hypothetical protein